LIETPSQILDHFILVDDSRLAFGQQRA